MATLPRTRRTTGWLRGSGPVNTTTAAPVAPHPVPARDRAQVGVVDGHLAAHPAHHGLAARVRPGEHDDLGARGPQPDHGLLEVVGELVDVAARHDQVVAAG